MAVGAEQRVPDGVSSSQSDPVGNGPVLLGLFAKNALDAEALEGGL